MSRTQSPDTTLHHVKAIKSLELALKELEPIIRDGRPLQTGRGFKSFGDMRPREFLANWIICAVLNWAGFGNLTITSDPLGGDGILLNRSDGSTFPTEHVMVHRSLVEGKESQTLILEAIAHKTARGEAYATGKTLVVFLDAPDSKCIPNNLARAIPTPLLFDSIWMVAFISHENGEYEYSAVSLDLSQGNAPIFYVRINSTFNSWVIRRTQ